MLGEVFDMRRLKADGMNEIEKKSMLTLDEMSITPSASGNRGAVREHNTTGHKGQATHALVFMLAGVTMR